MLLRVITSDIIGIDRVINSVESDIRGIESRVSSADVGVSIGGVKGCVDRWIERVSTLSDAASAGG